MNRSKRRGRSAPGRKDRGGTKGTPARLVVGLKPAVAPPPPVDGKERCPMCRNLTTLTPRGRLRQHHDLFGNDCPNRAPREHVHLEELPPVVLPPAPKPPAAPTPRSARRDKAEPSRLDVGSHCQECGKWLPGERRLCGRCFALGGRP